MRLSLLLTILLLSLSLSFCNNYEISRPDEDIQPVNLSSLNVNKADQVEIVTWNIEQFPKSGELSVQRTADIINGLNADIYAVQEIREAAFFLQLLEKCPGYEGVLGEASQFIKPGIIYRTSVLELADTKELFRNAGGDTLFYFASRSPLQADMVFRGTFPLTLINFHLKAFDDGEAERRRLESAGILHNYVEKRIAYSADSNFVLLGDWNDDLDDLTDSTTLHPFYVFWKDSLDFRFLTYGLANASDDSRDSYPGWPSFLDHVLISGSLFDEALSGEIFTVRLNDHLGGYFSNVSDHYPVVWTFTP